MSVGSYAGLWAAHETAYPMSTPMAMRTHSSETIDEGPVIPNKER